MLLLLLVDDLDDLLVLRIDQNDLIAAAPLIGYRLSPTGQLAADLRLLAKLIQRAPEFRPPVAADALVRHRGWINPELCRHAQNHSVTSVL